MNDLVEIKEGIHRNIQIIDGRVEDLDLLPRDLGMPSGANAGVGEDFGIKMGQLEFVYDEIKEEMEAGKSRLRLIRGSNRDIDGFAVVTPGDDLNVIKMVWVKPDLRRKGLGEDLIRDAIEIAPSEKVLAYIWGGEPAIKLANKMGFTQENGDRFVYRKP